MVSSSKAYVEPLRMLFTYLVIIFVYLSSSSSASAFIQRVAVAQNTIRCIERERQALLDFKHGLVDVNDILYSWGSDVDQRECCNWRGVHCNNNTGHVTMLDLHSLVDHGFAVDRQLVGHKVSPSLLELKHLNYLDLSYNDFQGNRIPEFIGSFRRLRVLSLMDANFASTVPPQLGNLTSLRVLNVTGSNLKIQNLDWLSPLSSLRCIDLSNVHFDLSESPETTIVSLPPFLEVLMLSNCELHGTLPFLLNSSSPFLSAVDFSYNHLSSSSVFHLLRNASKQLTTINLLGNNFKGLIPDAFGDMKFLDSLILDGNSFTNGIPKSFGNLTHLRSLSLFGNELNESIAELFEKLSEGAGKSLQILELSSNKLIGELPTDINTRFPSLRELRARENQLNGSLGLPSSLEVLDLSNNKIRGLYQDMKGSKQECDLRDLNLFNNQITGQFPDLSHFLSLTTLDLSENQLQGSLPETIGKLSKLIRLYASSNLLEGVVTEAHFSNLTQLQQLDLSFNVALSFNMSSNWVPPFQLFYIFLANCKLGPQFPKWLQTQNRIFGLDISSASISDIIPSWFWNVSTSSCTYLNLSYNNIGGRLPPSLETTSYFLEVMDLSSNNFWGSIDVGLRGLTLLQLSNNKFVGSISFLCSIINADITSIDLSNNQLSGEIPDCWDKHLSSLFLLNLANNRFSGKVPHSLGSLYRLQSLHLRNNNLTGELPSSFQNCTSLSVLDVGGNKLIGRIPSWIGGSLMKLLIVSLRNNKFYGNVPSSICHLNSIQILDLSRNKLTGEIPQCINNFTYLMKNNSLIGSTILRLNALSYQHSGGGIDYYIDNILVQWKNQDREYRKQLGLLKSIDLSSNQLTGRIPEQLFTLKGLISLNLSKNHLIGKIFPTIYHMEHLEVLDLSRNQLSGEIPIGLARLNYLAVLDLSTNFLSGKIPTSTQLQSFNASSYAGNIGLCGDPLPKCSAYVPPQNKNSDFQEEGDSFLDREFYISMVLGFSLCFWGIVVTLVLKDSWRIAYYEFLNDVKDWVYVKMKIYMVRLKRRLGRI